MNTMTILALASLAGAAALFIALVIFLHKIVKELENIGGVEIKTYGVRASLLSKIRLGVRAIEVQTGGIAPQVTTLNKGLSAIRDGLGAIDDNLSALITAVSKQGAR